MNTTPAAAAWARCFPTPTERVLRIAKAPEQSFAELFAERQILYQRYAEVTIPCDGLNQDEIADRIAAELWPMRLYSASGVPL